MTRPSGNSPQNKVFGFRLPPKERQIFLSRAQALAMSPGELARLYVMERLAANEADEDAREGLVRLEADLTAVRQELALATVAILQHGGKTSKPVAEEFAARNMGGSQPKL
jgi:hypothetical protein